jgi:hypothetical protein
LSYLSDTEAPVRRHFSPKRLADFDIAPQSIAHLGGQYSPDDEAYCQWVQIDPAPPLEILLWSPMAIEMGIRPALPGWLFLVDLDRRIAVNPYDDRGMDVISVDRETLVPLYRKFGEWLLDYDREQMDVTFGQ